MTIRWLCIGDIGWDVYEGINLNIKKVPGGISLNHLIHLKRFHQSDLYFLGPLSEKDDDRPLIDLLKENEVKILKPLEQEGHAPKQFIKITSNGEKDFIRYEAGLLETFNYDKPSEDFDLILMPIFSQNWSWAEKVLKNPPSGKLVCDFLDGWDFNQELGFLESFKTVIDLLVVGCPEEDEMFFKRLREMSGQWSRRVLVTRGKLSGFYFDGERFFDFTPKPLYQRSIVDSTGAGDAFLSSFLVSLTGGSHVNSSLEAASSYAANQLQKIGPH